MSYNQKRHRDSKDVAGRIAAGGHSGRGILTLAVSFLLVGSLAGCSMFSKATLDGKKDAPASMSSSNAMSTSEIYLDEPFIEPPIEGNTEEYKVITEHGFTSVLSKPFSTFAADIDTASYCNLRRMIKDGFELEDIPSGAVRVEEMLNYFSYDYAGPTGDEPFGVTTVVGDCPWNKDTKLLVVGLQTEVIPYEQTAGSNLVFLIDVSGSMASPDKLALLQESFEILLDQLSEKDTISIVTYSSGEKTILDGVKASEKTKILRALNKLEASGSTNGEAGLRMAYETAENNFIKGGNNRIILASDGDLNVGMTSESELHDYVSDKRDTGIYLSVLGFGSGNYKDNKMETLADDGNGNYFYIDGLHEARKVFEEDLCATLLTVADDVKLQVEFNPAYVKAYRQIGYENRELEAEDFEDDTKDAGEVGTGHSVTVAYELVMKDSALALPQVDSKYQNAEATSGVENGEWLTLSVRYKDPGTTQSKLLEYVIDETDYFAKPNEDWWFAAAVIEAAMAITQSENAGTGDLDAALEILDGLALSDDEYKLEFYDLMDEIE